jgi:MbtH protein
MSNNSDADGTVYKVVVSEDAQYSIWPAFSRSAPGWSDAGHEGNKESCLAWIQRTWTDLRPQRRQQLTAPHVLNNNISADAEQAQSELLAPARSH